MSGVSVLRAVRVPLYLGGEEGKGLASLGPFLLLEGLRQAPSKDPEQRPLELCWNGSPVLCITQGQYSVTTWWLTLTLPAPLLFLAPGLLPGTHKHSINVC